MSSAKINVQTFLEGKKCHNPVNMPGILQYFWDKTDIIWDKTDKKDKDKTDKKSDNIPDKFSCQVQTMFISYKVIDYR